MSTAARSKLQTSPMPASAAAALRLRVISPEDDSADDKQAMPSASQTDSASAQPAEPAFVPEPFTPPEPPAGLLEELEAKNAELETATPMEIIRWATERFGDSLTMATAFGPEGMTILYMLSLIAPETHVFNLDTGYQFQETLDLRDRVAEKYGIEVELKKPEQSVEEYEAEHGGPLYNRRPDQCCFQRKIKVLREGTKGKAAWITAIRRDQSPDRAKAPIVGWDKKFGLVKVNPLANWTKQQVWKLITDEDIPYNPLHDQGYSSIGCQPCTRAVLMGEDERAGRWSGFAKTECGLHSLDDK